MLYVATWIFWYMHMTFSRILASKRYSIDINHLICCGKICMMFVYTLYNTLVCCSSNYLKCVKNWQEFILFLFLLSDIHAKANQITFNCVKLRFASSILSVGQIWSQHLGICAQRFTGGDRAKVSEEPETLWYKIDHKRWIVFIFCRNLSCICL